MLFSNLSQFVVLGLTFFVGLIFAFVIHPGGRKWKTLYQEEVEENASYRNDADNEIRAAKRRIADLERDIAALQAEQAAPAALVAEPEPVAAEPEPVVAEPEPLVAAPLVAAESAIETAAIAPAEPEPIMAPAAPVEPDAVVAPIGAPPATESVERAPAAAEIVAEPAPPVLDKAWLGAAGYNDLTQIRGIDSGLNNRLFGLGVTRFADIEKLSAEDEMALEQRLNVPAGFIAREQWRDQAALLRAGNVAEHSARFGSVVAPA